MLDEVAASELVAAGQAAFLVLAPPMRAGLTPTLIDLKPSLMEDWVLCKHRDRVPSVIHNIGAFVFNNVTCSGRGQITFEHSLISSPDVIPFYWLSSLRSVGSDSEEGRIYSLPIRRLKGTVLLVSGHGINVYGHVLLELLSRLELVCKMGKQVVWDTILLPVNTPVWVRQILADHYQLGAEKVSYFDPSIEQVHIERAVVPTQIWADEQFHPYTNMLFESIKERIGVDCIKNPAKRVFLSRKGFFNPASIQRSLANEDILERISTEEFDFDVVHPENLTWRDQVNLMQQCSIVVGMYGSALHNTIFSQEKPSVISVGMMNMVQTEIAALCHQSCSYLTVNKNSESSNCDEQAFRSIISRVIDFQSEIRNQ